MTVMEAMAVSSTASTSSSVGPAGPSRLDPSHPLSALLALAASSCDRLFRALAIPERAVATLGYLRLLLSSLVLSLVSSARAAVAAAYWPPFLSRHGAALLLRKLAALASHGASRTRAAASTVLARCTPLAGWLYRNTLLLASLLWSLTMRLLRIGPLIVSFVFHVVSSFAKLCVGVLLTILTMSIQASMSLVNYIFSFVSSVFSMSAVVLYIQPLTYIAMIALLVGAGLGVVAGSTILAVQIVLPPKSPEKKRFVEQSPVQKYQQLRQAAVATAKPLLESPIPSLSKKPRKPASATEFDDAFKAIDILQQKYGSLNKTSSPQKKNSIDARSTNGPQQQIVPLESTRAGVSSASSSVSSVDSSATPLCSEDDQSTPTSPSSSLIGLADDSAATLFNSSSVTPPFTIKSALKKSPSNANSSDDHPKQIARATVNGANGGSTASGKSKMQQEAQPSLSPASPSPARRLSVPRPAGGATSKPASTNSNTANAPRQSALASSSSHKKLMRTSSVAFSEPLTLDSPPLKAAPASPDTPKPLSSLRSTKKRDVVFSISDPPSPVSSSACLYEDEDGYFNLQKTASNAAISNVSSLLSNTPPKNAPSSPTHLYSRQTSTTSPAGLSPTHSGTGLGISGCGRQGEEDQQNVGDRACTAAAAEPSTTICATTVPGANNNRYHIKLMMRPPNSRNSSETNLARLYSLIAGAGTGDSPSGSSRTSSLSPSPRSSGLNTPVTGAAGANPSPTRLPQHGAPADAPNGESAGTQSGPSPALAQDPDAHGRVLLAAATTALQQHQKRQQQQVRRGAPTPTASIFDTIVEEDS